jgi:transaldolase/transaldolase/glucose-6-phosphate isomerase
MKTNNVIQIRELGQSIWLDFFDRKIMDTGKLMALIEEDAVSGVTFNPSIFEKAISGSSDYDEDIAALSEKKSNSNDIFYSLAIKDIKRAADLFKPVYERSNGEDGFVSLEVSPHLAHDTEGTIKQARELWRLACRKNVMIKIPGTPEGLPAIRKCISEGININVTLLFGLARYLKVTAAYIAGLEDRIKANKPIDRVISVASFFLSRIDARIDPMLEEKGVGRLKGEMAIASAKMAYVLFKNVFAEESFKALEAKGAKRQRLLWASTSSKDPSFSDVKYVEALIGKETVNTITLATLEAFRDHGQPGIHLEDALTRAGAVLTQVKKEGIDIDIITQELEDEGIMKFNKDYDEILEAINTKKLKQLIYDQPI